MRPQNFPWQHLVAGAAGGAISRTATAPLELLRLQAMTASIELQSDGGTALLRQRPDLMQALKASMGQQGWQGLWKGNGLNVLRAGPQKAIDFFSFELYKVSLVCFKAPTAVSSRCPSESWSTQKLQGQHHWSVYINQNINMSSNCLSSH